MSEHGLSAGGEGATSQQQQHLLRPALELAVAVARAGEQEDPPVEAPGELRRLVRFTRLPERSLAVARRVLDGDPGFRARVRDRASEAGVGRAGWLFLDRPPGWEVELDRATAEADRADRAAADSRAEDSARRRLGAVEKEKARLEQARSSLRSELDRLGSELREERRVRRRAQSDIGRLRHTLAAREVDLAQAQRQLAAAEVPWAERDRVVVPPADPPGAAEEAVAEEAGGGETGEALREMTSAMEEAESAVATAATTLRAAAARLAGIDAHHPDGARTGSPSPAPSAPTPAKPVARQPAPLPPGVFEDTVEAAEHLLRGSSVLMLVDGYNVTKLAHPELGLLDQRQWLLDSAAALAARAGIEVQVVFDGDGESAEAPAGSSRRTRVQARFSPAGVTADDLLLDLAAGVPATRSVVVASSDREVQEGARGLGARVIDSGQLVQVLRRSGRA